MYWIEWPWMRSIMAESLDVGARGGGRAALAYWCDPAGQRPHAGMVPLVLDTTSAMKALGTTGTLAGAE